MVTHSESNHSWCICQRNLFEGNYTQSQKKRTMDSLVSSVTQGQGQVTPGRVKFYHQEDSQTEIGNKVHLSTLFRKRQSTFHGMFLLRLSVSS